MENLGYNPKNLIFDQEGRDKLIKGIETIAGAVKSTLGPYGQTVLIESPLHTHGITVTKDGVTVAKSVDLIDPVENLAVSMMKEAADRTATSAGDGTTTSIVLTEAIVKEGLKRIIKGENKTEVLRQLVEGTKEVVKSLQKNSRAVTKGKLKDVATISANNDSEIGNIIAKVFKEVGKNGIVTVDKSQTSETHYETTHGFKIDRGYASNLFINDQKKDECIFDDTYVLVSDSEISNLMQVENILKKVVMDNEKLLIIAPCSMNFVNTMAANKMKRDVKICIVPPPSFGYRQHELMQDIAVALDATYYSEKTGDDLSHMTFEDLGKAKKVIVGGESTVIVKEESDSEKVNERVSQLRDAHANATRKADREFIMSRIAALTGGIGVIYAGGNTDLEQKELYDRIDDAVCAVNSALEEGILPGGGIALTREAMKLDGKFTVASQILASALRAPLEQIITNAGDEVFDDALLEFGDYNNGYNVKTQKWGNMYDMGVIDPMKVTKSALENAVSVAVTILSTNAIITMARTIEKDGRD